MVRLVAAALALSLSLALAPAAHAAADPRRGEQWNLDMIGSDAAHATATGAGAVVAVVDTGVRGTHPDLQGRLREGRDVVDRDDDPADGEGHGTHVSGIVVANEANGVGIGSVAPGARVMPVRVLDDTGGGTVEDVVAGIDWATEHGADVINLSLSLELPGDTSAQQLLGQAIDRALARGVVVVAAAGNNSLPVCENPSAQGRVLCVGAVDRRRQRSFFSSFGEGLGLMAPGGAGIQVRGEEVLSTYLRPDYEEVSGTSQAAPHVAGVAALLVGLGVRGQDAVQRILATASDAGLPGPDAEYGAGIVDARAAVAGLQAPGGDGDGSGSAVRVSVPRTQRIRVVLRRGLLVRCRAAGAGRCRVVAKVRGRRIVSGSAALEAGRTRSFRARTTRSGRRVLRRTRRVRALVEVRLPGSPVVRRRVLLRR